MNEKSALDYVLNEESRLNSMLAYYLKAANLGIPAEPRILNIGCGKTADAHIFSGFFAEFQMPDSLLKKVDYTGIDISAEKIEDIRQQYSQAKGNISYNFISGDARDLGNLVQGNFNVIISRHPNIIDNLCLWEKIYKSAHSVAGKSAIFIGTTLNIYEHRLLAKVVSKSGYSIVLQGQNIFSQELTRISDISFSFDNYLLIAQKLECIPNLSKLSRLLSYLPHLPDLHSKVFI